MTGVGTAIMMKSALPISSGLSVKAMPGVIIRPGELPDLARVHVEADRLQVSGERECKRQSDIAETGDADGFVF